MKDFFLRPWIDFLEAMEKTLARSMGAGMAGLFLGLGLGWWVYVPIHELLHALGCLAAGGSVWKLEISPEYGAALLQKVFPFVTVGSDYAGQLTGFDTHGNDLTYLATVYAPFLLSMFVGVPLLLAVIRRGSTGFGAGLLTGLAMLLSYMPFANLIGDFYEIGSILVSRLVATFAELDPARWRSDDLVKLVGELRSGGSLGGADAIGLSAGFVIGVLGAFATYWLGRWTDRWIGRPRTQSP